MKRLTHMDRAPIPEAVETLLALFDEVDALTKDRGDSSDHGELKRAVNAVLQMMDGYRGSSVLIATTNYESILDPGATWLANFVLHQWHECWAYWSAMEDETDERVRAIYELHCNMEIEHLRIACELMSSVEKRDPLEILPQPGFEEGLKFQSNKAYVREILESQVDLTAKHSDFVPVSTLPEDDRYFAYQEAVNGDWVPTEEVVRENAAKNGEEYRLETEGPSPVEGLRPPKERNGSETDYARGPKAA